jgi:phosphohistidine phosphatase
MKTVILVRHAKAEQNFLSNDFERKLTDVGKENAQLVANRFFSKGIKIDAFISSPAKRAKTTAQIFVEIYKIDKEKIIFKSELYHAPLFVYYDVISQLDAAIETVILFAHNPGITDFVNSLGIVQLDNMPTSGIFSFTLNTDDWKKAPTAIKNFVFFDYPKA